MPDFTGDFDQFGLDLKGNRLFLAHSLLFSILTRKRVTALPCIGVHKRGVVPFLAGTLRTNTPTILSKTDSLGLECLRFNATSW